ncbi:glycosyltransferase [Endozoicomonas gorgoniicola]|uniref:Glycosyltransferase n=1 Tax=Endozoicomonas gorgoniicola TaxID=1234144 RepID=A0ABT3MV08_9GAMM|nr:glycosyltransferase [Endozoicomonas gorgoniicola]MCW7553210.1 glycosyltransferase [Endozoicomonas gorgoniicola]
MSALVATLFSIYKNDSVEIIRESFSSLVKQTYNNVLIYIVCDGELKPDVENYLSTVKSSKVRLVRNDTNIGLAASLNKLVDVILTNELHVDYFARMDADDISHSTRFKKQVDFLTSHPDIDVVGSSVFEVDHEGKLQSYKRMQVSDWELKKNIIRRCPFNHPSVMFRRRVFESGNRYSPNLKNTQDYYLWIDLAKKGYKFSNIDEPLLCFRVDQNFHARRGKSKAKNDFNAKIYAMREMDCYSLSNWFYAFAIYLLRMSPPFLSKFAYKFLRGAESVTSDSDLAKQYKYPEIY